MKTILAILFLAHAAHAVTIPNAEYAEIRARIVAMRAAIQDQAVELEAAKKAKDALGGAVGNLVLTNASQSSALITTQRETLAAVKETALVQAAMDKQAAQIEKLKAENAKQAAKLERWQTFGRAVLLAVFVVVFGYVWQLLGYIPFFKVTPYAYCLRAAAAMLVGGAASRGLFYAITRLL